MKNQLRQPDKKAPSKSRLRLTGLLALAISLLLGYLFVYRPVEAMQHQAEVRYSLKAMFLIPFCFVFGLYLLLFPPSPGNAGWKNMSVKEKVSLVAIFSIGFLGVLGLFFWFNSQLLKYGYESLF